MGQEIFFDKQSIEQMLSQSIPTAVIGGGYSTDRTMATFQPCLTGTVAYQGQGSGGTFTQNSVSSTELKMALGFDVAAGVSLAFFDVGAMAEFAASIEDTHTSVFVPFIYQNSLPAKTFNVDGIATDVLNNYGSGVYKEGPERFREECGDQYVYQQHLGISLIAGLKLTFNNFQMKAQFMESVGAAIFPLVGIGEKLDAALSLSHYKGKLDFFAFQNGGDPTELAKIYNSTSPSNCDFVETAGCYKMIDNVVNYAATNLPNQVSITDTGQVEGNPAVVGTTYGHYEDLSLNVTDVSRVTDDISDMREQLVSLYKNNTDALNDRVDLVQSAIDIRDENVWQYWNATDITTAVKANIAQDIDTLQHNIALLKNADPVVGAIGCWFDPDGCTDIGKSLQNNLTTVSNDSVAPLKFAYSVTGLSNDNGINVEMILSSIGGGVYSGHCCFGNTGIDYADFTISIADVGDGSGVVLEIIEPQEYSAIEEQCRTFDATYSTSSHDSFDINAKAFMCQDVGKGLLSYCSSIGASTPSTGCLDGVNLAGASGDNPLSFQGIDNPAVSVFE